MTTIPDTHFESPRSSVQPFDPIADGELTEIKARKYLEKAMGLDYDSAKTELKKVAFRATDEGMTKTFLLADLDAHVAASE